MSEFPNQLDTDVDLPRVDGNITDIGGEAINALRSSMFAVEGNIGLSAQGTLGSIAARLNVSLNQDGTLSTSALLGLLTTISITDAQVSPTAAIQESKIALTYSTSSLYNLITLLSNSVDIINQFISITGVKVEPHIAGTAYNHDLSAILIDSVSAPEYTNRFLTNRDTANSNTLLLDINSDFSNHERADGTAPSPAYPIQEFTTLSGEIVPSNFAHAASGIFINASNFSTVPQTETNLQSFAEEVDILLGNSVQNLFSNGIIRASRSTILSEDGYAQPVVPPTPVTTHLLGVPPNLTPSSSPVDNITFGDDVITFNPSSPSLANSSFDAAFGQVKAGDIITVNYGNGVAAQFAIDSVKAVISGLTRVYAVRIIGKNLFSSTVASARIDQSLFQANKFGVLSASRAAVLNGSGQNAINSNESLIVSNPKGAIALGIGFNASQFDASHYNLYLTLYPTGNPSDQVINLPPIDVTGNKGATQGSYTLDSIVNATNLAFRAPGYNYRFVAFEYGGDFGVALADSYNNAAFSIIGSTVDGYGTPLPTVGTYSNNAVDGYNVIDPLGFGTSAANVASPAYSASYITPIAANVAPTLIFYALRKNYYYINGTERDSLKSDPSALNNIVDNFGDGYWPATISSVMVNGSTIATTYSLNYDLSTSGIEDGKTIVVQPAFPITDPRYSFVDYGRFVVNAISMSGCDTSNPITTLTVYDAVHGTGISPYATSDNIPVFIYFSDDSVSFDAQNVADNNAEGPFKRFFEIYVDQNGHTFTHERGRFATSGLMVSNINLSNISRKLTGFNTNTLSEIQLNIINFNSLTGEFTGYTSAVNGMSNIGNTISGRQGETVRFYDDTNIDFIDIIFNISDVITSFSNQAIVIQLFPSLQLNQDFFLLATCQINDNTKLISNLSDARQFGNVSEAQLSNSALDFINTNARETGQNGIVRGFDLISSSTLTLTNKILFTGGLALTNGQFNAINTLTATIPLVQDNNGGTPTSGVLWAVCVNQGSELQLIPLTDYNPDVNSINNPGRQLQLFNVTNSQIYYVDSATFSGLINDRKDLTVLWLVNSQVTNSTTYTLTISDVRKYVTDADANTLMTITGGDSQGNFKSIASLNNWATYNSAYQNNVVVRGAFVFASDPGLSSGLVMSGDGTTNSFTFNSTATLTGVTFNNITFNINAPITVGSGCVFNKCTINVSGLGTGIIVSGSAVGVEFNGCDFTYVPNTTMNYSSANLINSGTGLIYCSTNSLENFSVEDCSFTTNTSTRFSFINIEYNSAASYARSIYIRNNKFYNTSSLDDMYAVIAIISTLTSAQPLEGLKLIDCRIENNTCDKNQMIALTGTLNGLNLNSTIVPVSTQINGNICGTIAIICAADSDRNYETSSDGYASFDKNYGITISKNTCRYIGAITSNGVAFYSSSSNTMHFIHSSVMISGNAASWIHIFPSINVSFAPYARNATLFITNNSLRAYNPSFIVALGESTAANIAIYSANNNTFSGYAIISGNTIAQGNYLTIFNTVQTYDYIGCISVGCNSVVIDGNIFNNLANAFDMIAFNGTNDPTANITNNQFYQNSANIHSYINLNGSGTGIISGNFFDSPTVTGGSTALISNLSGTTYVIGPNVNYYHVLPRGIVQPLVVSASIGTPTDNATEIVFNSAAGALKMFNVINGATLASISFDYSNGSTLTSPPVFNFQSINIAGGLTSITGDVSGSTVSGGHTLAITPSNSTLPANFTIDDSSLVYILTVVNANGVNVSVFPITLNFS